MIISGAGIAQHPEKAQISLLVVPSLTWLQAGQLSTQDIYTPSDLLH